MPRRSFAFIPRSSCSRTTADLNSSPRSNEPACTYLTFDHYDTLEETYANLRTLAHALGAEDRAKKLIATCQARVADLEQRLAHVQPVRVIAPSTYGLIPGRDTTFQDLCDHAGAENLAATLGGLRGHARPPSEQMLTWLVDRLVLGGTNLDEAIAVFARVPPYEFMPAFKQRRVVLLEPYMLSCVSHRRIDGYEMLARALHPEVFAASGAVHGKGTDDDH